MAGGDDVERALEETVPLLRHARKLKILSAEDVATIVRRRRDHEYALQRPGAGRATFLRYAAFERETTALFAARAAARSVPEKRARSIAAQQGARVNLVYSRAIRKFKGDVQLYLHYAKHCVETGARGSAEKVLMRAIAHRGDSEKVWIAAMGFHFEACGDVKTARAIAQRGLRAMRGSKALWLEYFRMELVYIAKLIARRVAIGVVGVADVEEVGADDGGRLGFWGGGVPLSVFRSAAEAAGMTAGEGVGYARIAAAMPFVPLLLLEALGKELGERFGEGVPCVECLEMRNGFDVALAKWRVAKSKFEAGQAGKKMEAAARVEIEEDGSVTKEEVTALWKAALKNAKDFLAKAEAKDAWVENREDVSIVVEVLVEFADAVANDIQGSNGSIIKRCRRLQEKLEGGDRECGVDEAPKSLDGVVSAVDWKGYLSGPGAQAFADGDIALLGAIRESLQACAGVPFRSADQETICVLWLKWEKDQDRLRGACDTILALPPSSMVLIEAAISAELNLGGEVHVERVRSLFSKAASVKDATKSVEFWVKDFQFERDVAKDPARSAHVTWAAKKKLDAVLHADFEESCLLLNFI